MFPIVGPVEIAGYATDAAPVERATFEALCMEVIRRSASMEFGDDVRNAALLYAGEVANRAFTLGYRLGHDEGRMTGRQEVKEEATRAHDQALPVGA